MDLAYLQGYTATMASAASPNSRRSSTRESAVTVSHVAAAAMTVAAVTHRALLVMCAPRLSGAPAEGSLPIPFDRTCTVAGPPPRNGRARGADRVAEGDLDFRLFGLALWSVSGSAAQI